MAKITYPELFDDFLKHRCWGVLNKHGWTCRSPITVPFRKNPSQAPLWFIEFSRPVVPDLRGVPLAMFDLGWWERFHHAYRRTVSYRRRWFSFPEGESSIRLVILHDLDSARAISTFSEIENGMLVLARAESAVFHALTGFSHVW